MNHSSETAPVESQESKSSPLMDAKAVSDYVGFSKATLYNMVRDGEFPKPVRVSSRLSRWLQSEVDTWIQSRAEERNV